MKKNILIFILLLNSSLSIVSMEEGSKKSLHHRDLNNNNIKANKKTFFNIIEPVPDDSIPQIAQSVYDDFPEDFPDTFKTTLDYFENPGFYAKAKGGIDNNFLVWGPPGSGKSYLIEKIHKVFQLPLISLKSTDFQDKWHGESGNKISEVYSITHKKPIIIFIDELEAIAKERTEKSSEAFLSTLDPLLCEIQNQYGNPQRFTFVATNHKELIDPAVISRFRNFCVEVKHLNYKNRKLYIKNIFRDLVLRVSEAAKEEAFDTLTEACANLPRREIKHCFYSAHKKALRVSKGLDGSVPLDIALEIITVCQSNGNTDSLSTKAHKFVINSQPYLNWFNSILSPLLQIWQAVSSHENQNFHKGLAILQLFIQRTDRRIDQEKYEKDKFERDRWQKISIHASINPSDADQDKNRIMSDLMLKNDQLSFEEAEKQAESIYNRYPHQPYFNSHLGKIYTPPVYFAYKEDSKKQ